MIPKEEVIRILNLKPLIGEGGLWSQPYVSDEIIKANTSPDRPVCSTIHFLLTPSMFSCMHRLKSDETWYHHSGPAVELLLIHEDGSSEVKVLGQDLLHGELPQITVKRNTWEGCRMKEDGEYTLLSTCVSPAYQDSDFEKGDYEELKTQIKEEYLPLLKALTEEPRYQ